MSDPMSVRVSENLRIRLDFEAERRGRLAGISVAPSRVLIVLAEERLAQIAAAEVVAPAAADQARTTTAGRTFPTLVEGEGDEEGGSDE